jgi:hypothetical protein
VRSKETEEKSRHFVEKVEKFEQKHEHPPAPICGRWRGRLSEGVILPQKILCVITKITWENLPSPSGMAAQKRLNKKDFC